MSVPPWATDRAWTPESAAREIARAFPHLAHAPVEPLGEGFDYTVFVADHLWAVKFPKRDDYSRSLLVETALLDEIHYGCPLMIPRYELIGETARGDVFGGYRIIDGVPALEAAPESTLPRGSAALLAAFISHIHAFSADRAEALGLTVFEPELSEPWRNELLDELAQAAQALDLDQARRAEAAIRELPLDPPPGAAPRTVLHGDLAADHFVLEADTSRIVGVIDWSDAFIGDPAVDFGGIYAWQGRDYAERVASLCLATYDDGLLDRAEAYAINGIVGAIRYGLLGGVPAQLEAGRMWLTRFLAE